MAEEKNADEKNAAGGTGTGKHKKVSKMTLAEIDHALETLRKTMGGHHSAYARQILDRKQILLREKQGV